MAPDEGETVAEVFYREKPHREAPQLAPDEHGFIWMPKEAFGAAFSQHTSPEQAALFAATQRPIAVACIKEKAPRPAWKTKSSWYLVAEEDRMINPATQLYHPARYRAGSGRRRDPGSRGELDSLIAPVASAPGNRSV